MKIASTVMYHTFGLMLLFYFWNGTNMIKTESKTVALMSEKFSF